jgi:hypothetical protein
MRQCHSREGEDPLFSAFQIEQGMTDKTSNVVLPIPSKLACFTLLCYNIIDKTQYEKF